MLLYALFEYIFGFDCDIRMIPSRKSSSIQENNPFDYPPEMIGESSSKQETDRRFVAGAHCERFGEFSEFSEFSESSSERAD